MVRPIFEKEIPMNEIIRRAARSLRTMTIPEKLQLMVKSGSLTQEQADEAIKRLAAEKPE